MIPTRWAAILLGAICALALAPAIGQTPETPEGQGGVARPLEAPPLPGEPGVGPDLAGARAMAAERVPAMPDGPEGIPEVVRPEPMATEVPVTLPGEPALPPDGGGAEAPAAGVADAADAPAPPPQPGGPGHSNGRSTAARELDYRTSVRSEATRSQADTQQPTAPAQPPGRSRIDLIRGIVSEAVEAPSPLARDQAPAGGAEPSEADRRKRLMEAVSSTPEPAVTQGDPYVSTLREEGSKTVVIDVETAKRPAAPGVGGGVPPGQPTLSTTGYGIGGAANTYTVQEGDSLWRIARRLYGDGFRYLELYEANQDTIGNENILIVGQVLRLPEPPAVHPAP